MATYEYREIVPFNSTADEVTSPIMWFIYMLLVVCAGVNFIYYYPMKTVYTLRRWSEKDYYGKEGYNRRSLHFDIAFNFLIGTCLLVIVNFGAAWGLYINQILGHFVPLEGGTYRYPVPQQDIYGLVISSMFGIQLLCYSVGRFMDMYRDYSGTEFEIKSILFDDTMELKSTTEAERRAERTAYKKARIDPILLKRTNRPFYTFISYALPIMVLSATILFMSWWTWLNVEGAVKPFSGPSFGPFGTITAVTGTLLVGALLWLYIWPAARFTWWIPGTNNSYFFAGVDFVSRKVYSAYVGRSDCIMGYTPPNMTSEERHVLPFSYFEHAIMGHIEQIFVPWYWIITYVVWWFPVSVMNYIDDYKAVSAAAICAALPGILALLAHSPGHFIPLHIAATFLFFTFSFLLESMAPPPDLSQAALGNVSFQSAIDYNFMTTGAWVPSVTNRATTVWFVYWAAFVGSVLTFGFIYGTNPEKQKNKID